PSFEQSRATIASCLVIVLGGLITLFLYWYAGTVRSLDRTAAAAARQRSAKVDKLAKGRTAGMKRAVTKGADEAGTDRTIAPAAAEIAGVVIGISSAEVAPITVNNRETETLYLRLTVRVTNLSNQPLSFVGWHFAGTKATLRDSTLNYFNHIKFFPSE